MQEEMFRLGVEVHVRTPEWMEELLHIFLMDFN